MDITGLPAKSTSLQNLSRLTTICCALLHEYCALRRFAGGAADEGAPVRFAARLTPLGSGFVKLVQILSTRPDVLPPAYVKALSTLQETGSKVSPEQVRLIIERDLGKPIEHLFRTFDQSPAAAASLAQVHRATLPDGTTAAF